MSGATEPVPSPPAPRRRLPAALGPRTLVATAVVAGFAALAWADAVGLWGARPAWWLLPAAVLVAARGAGEYAALFARGQVVIRAGLVPWGTAVPTVFVVVGATVAPAATPAASSVAGLGWGALGCVAAVGSLLGAEVIRYGREPGPVARAAAGAIVVTMLGLPLAFLAALRIAGGDAAPLAGLAASAPAPPPVFTALVPLVSLIAAVKGGDIAAYLVGSLVGRHRMAPRLSPGKTWEGAAAGLVASVALAWLLIEPFGSGRRPLGGAVMFGLVVAALGMLGDLAESLIKRETGAKDSGAVLGRMGGVLDLVDSLSFAAPGGWALWVLGGGP